MNKTDKKTKKYTILLSYQQEYGCIPPFNTPLSQDIVIDSIINQEKDIFIWSPKQQKNSLDDIKQIINSDSIDYSQVQHLEFLRNRKQVDTICKGQFWKIQVHNKTRIVSKQSTPNTQQTYPTNLKRQIADPLVNQRKQEISHNYKWLEVQQKQDSENAIFFKEIKFRLNQIAPQNYLQVSKMLLTLIMSNSQGLQQKYMILEYILDKGAHEEKYRNIYGQFLDDWMKLEGKNVTQIKEKICGTILQNMRFLDFESIQQQYITLDDNDKLIQETKRKKRVLGNAKFIAVLLRIKIVTPEFVNEAIRIVLQEYIEQYPNVTELNLKHNEQNLEILITIIHESGLVYLSNSQMSTNEKQYLMRVENKIPQLQPTRLSKQGALGLIKALQCSYKLSKRLSILLDNLKEEIFDEKTKQPKSTSESEGEDFKNTKAKKQMIKKSLKLVPVKETEVEQQLSSAKPITCRDIIILVDLWFKNHDNDLSMVLNRITCEEQWIQFWKTFFCSFLDVTTDNIEQANLASQIYENYGIKCAPEILFAAMTFQLNDKIYDIIESPRGLDFICQVLKPLVNKYFSLVALITFDEPDDDIQDFMINVFGRIVTGDILTQDAQICVMQSFIVDNLSLSIEKQQLFWQKII